MVKGMFSQNWDLYRPRLDDMAAPVWQLLYDEHEADLVLDETNEVTLIIRLGRFREPMQVRGRNIFG